MFLGTYAPKLDEKGRVILPAKFREDLSTGIVMTRGQERCLYVFTSRDFAGAEQAFRQAIVADAGLAEAHYNLALTLDRAGRKDEAKKHYIEAANLAPGNKVIWDSPPLHQSDGLDHDIERKSYLDPTPRGF